MSDAMIWGLALVLVITGILTIVTQGKLDIIEMYVKDCDKELRSIRLKLKSQTEALENHTGKPIYDGPVIDKPAKVISRKDRVDAKHLDEQNDWN